MPSLSQKSILLPTSPSQPYRGRFAPTPTGPLHFGSLVAALASYLDAKAHQGVWLLRIEDLDPPREDPSAHALIQQQLEAHGLLWDETLIFQSQQSTHYEATLQWLREHGHLFACQCSRSKLKPTQGRHLGRCSFDPGGDPSSSSESDFAWRLSVPDSEWSFHDRVYGEVSQNLLRDVGDQVLKRRDGFYAYQLAVVVDDIQSNISHVVRGADLLDNTARQCYLRACLGAEPLTYLHLPLATNAAGQKLSKQNKAEPLDLNSVSQNLFRALRFLGQQPPSALAQEPSSTILEWGIEHWDASLIRPSDDGLIN